MVKRSSNRNSYRPSSFRVQRQFGVLGQFSGEFLRMVVVFFHQDFLITCMSVALGFVFCLIFTNSLLDDNSYFSVLNGYSFTKSSRESQVFMSSLLRFD